MINGYAIAALCILLSILISIVTHSVRRMGPQIADPKHQEMVELMRSGQAFHGQLTIPEGNRMAIYTVKLRHERGAFVYQTFKNGELVETIRDKTFDGLFARIEQRGILSLDELDLAL